MKKALVEELFPIGKKIDYEKSIKAVEKHWPISEEAEALKTSAPAEKVILTFPKQILGLPGMDNYIHAITGDFRGKMDFGALWSLFAEMTGSRWIIILQKPFGKVPPGVDYEVTNILEIES